MLHLGTGTGSVLWGPTSELARLRSEKSDRRSGPQGKRFGWRGNRYPGGSARRALPAIRRPVLSKTLPIGASLKHARLPPLERKLEAVVAGVEPDGLGLSIRYTTRIGARELVDHIELGPRGSLEAVHGVGRVLRLLRAGRIAPPADPYSLAADLECAVRLIERCRGARVTVRVRRRYERVLTLWTEGGVQRIERVLDYREEPTCLLVRRLSGSLLRIPRESVVRYSASSSEYFQVLSVDVLSP